MMANMNRVPVHGFAIRVKGDYLTKAILLSKRACIPGSTVNRELKKDCELRNFERATTGFGLDSGRLRGLGTGGARGVSLWLPGPGLVAAS